MTEETTKPVAPAQDGQPPIYRDATGLERLIFFSDAVFAIAITLLALEIRLPAGYGQLSDAALLRELLAMWQKYLSFIISFLVIGSFWVGHHRKFRLIDRYDRRLLWINLLLLMSIAFLPFPTAVISENSGKTATILYAASMAVSGLMLAVLWRYVSRGDRLIAPHLDPEQRRLETRRTLVLPTVFLLSILVALFDADLAKFSWILIAPAILLLR